MEYQKNSIFLDVNSKIYNGKHLLSNDKDIHLIDEYQDYYKNKKNVIRLKKTKSAMHLNSNLIENAF